MSAEGARLIGLYRTQFSSTPNSAESDSASATRGKLDTEIKVAKVPTSVIPRARTLAETRGFLKAVIDARTNQILGFAMLAPEAGEVTAVVQMAILGRLPFTALRDGVLAHPTMAEGLNYLFGSAMRELG